jgi:hypothetical protein
MRNRAFRRHQAYRHMWRRLKEDRNQHYRDLDCPCWSDPKAMARFKEQPQRCSRMCCGNQRKYEGLTLQERRAQLIEIFDELEKRLVSPSVGIGVRIADV